MRERVNVRLQGHHDPYQSRERNGVEEDVTQHLTFVSVHSVAVLMTTILWASIILPITPPVLFAEHIRTCESPMRRKIQKTARFLVF